MHVIFRIKTPELGDVMIFLDDTINSCCSPSKLHQSGCPLLLLPQNGSEWQPVFKVIMDAEGNVEAVLKVVAEFEGAILAKSASVAADRTDPLPTQLDEVKALKTALTKSMHQLKEQKRLFFNEVDLEKILFPEDEVEIGEPEFNFIGGKKEVERAIISKVQRKTAKDAGKVLDSDDDDEMPRELPSNQVVIEMCSKLEALTVYCATASDASNSLVLARLL